VPLVRRIRPRHNLAHGYHSGHTSPEALQISEARIDATRDTFVAKGRL
jgi:hypothetical protein